MDQRPNHQQSDKDGRSILGDISNNNSTTHNVNSKKNSRLKEARLSLSRLTQTNLSVDSLSLLDVPLQSTPSSYDSLEEKATPLKKRKRVNSVAILRRTKPRKENIGTEPDIANKSEIKDELLTDFYKNPTPSPLTDYSQSSQLMNIRTPSSLRTINQDALYEANNSSYKKYHIDNGIINMIDSVEPTDNNPVNIPTDTFTEKGSIIDSDRSLTNMTWLPQLGDEEDTGASTHQQQTLVTTHFPQVVQPMVRHHQRPPYSYSALIQFAISSSTTGRMTLREIYQWIEDNFPFFRTAKPGWKNSIRHNLSLHKMFIRQPPPGPGKSAFWTLQPGTIVRLPSKRNLNFHNEGPEQITTDDPGQRSMYVNQRSGGSATIGHRTKQPFLLPRPNPSMMNMPIIWNPNTETYSVMQTVPNNMIIGDMFAYGNNCMVPKPQHSTPVIKIAPKINQPLGIHDRLLDSHRWPTHIPQIGHLAVDSGFETDTSGMNMFECSNTSDMKSNYLTPDIAGSYLLSKRESEKEESMKAISTPVKDSSITPSKGISATSTPAKLFHELDFLSPIRGVSNLRTSQAGLSPLGKYLMSPSHDNMQYKSPMLGSLREFGLPGFTPKKEDDMNVSVHNQSFEEIFGDMNISLDLVAAAADISWSAF